MVAKVAKITAAVLQSYICINMVYLCACPTFVAKFNIRKLGI